MKLTHHASRLTHQQGIALVIVMISIIVLALLAGGFAKSMKVETKLAQHANNQTELLWLGRSGVEYARWVLALQASCPMENYDALNQIWAGGPGGPCVTNGALAEVQKEIHLGNGYFTWKITDLERKWNINTMARPGGQDILQHGLMLMGVDPSQMTPIVNSILNWIDKGTRLEGADSDYYQGLNPPYLAKNGPIDDLSELLLIKGVSSELYLGANSSNNLPSVIQQQLNNQTPQLGFDQGPAFNAGLVDLFTPISSGMININTASAEVLQLIPGVDPRVAEAIVSGRQGDDDGSGLLGPYRDVRELQRVPDIPLGMIPMIQRYCVVQSKTFEVEIEAHAGGSTRIFHAILVRANGPRDRNTQVVGFYWKGDER